MSTKRFRIALSFAGQKRDFVAKVAAILAARFGEDAILYDKFLKSECARDELDAYLTELYRDESDLIVAVLCGDYDRKEWCGLEWKTIRGLLKQGKADEIMLTRFDLFEPKALEGLAGYIDLDEETPESTATLILERLALNEGKLKDHYTADATTPAHPHSTTIPNNLPSLQPFFGRTEELKQIAEALEPGARTWGVLIVAPGGMGKTSLAKRAAYDCKPGQFDRIVFLSKKNRELDNDGERELGTFILPGFLEMLNELAQELERPDIPKAVETERLRLILEVLEQARVLLILDNLESLTKSDRDQLLTFLERLPQGCKAILTSRRRFGSASEVIQLGPLDQDTALATLAELAEGNRLLGETADAEREAERLTLWKQTGGNPLLLRWAAGQLGLGSCRTLDQALAFLRSCPDGNDPLEFIFGDLANEFTADETIVLVALTYLAQLAKVEHIAELAGIDESSVETALRILANRSLVVPDQEGKQYSLVPMVAAFVRKHRPEVVHDTSNRLEQRAYALIVENGYSKNAPFKLLDAAWPTLAPALPLFLAGPNDRLQTVCDALEYFLEFTGRWDERLSLYEKAEAKAIKSGDEVNAGERAHEVGWIHYLRQQADDVLRCAEKEIKHRDASQAGARDRASAIRLRGLGHRLKGDYPAAITDYDTALDLYATLPVQTENVAIVLNYRGEAERLLGNFDAAERDYKSSLEVARTVGFHEGVACYTGDLAALALDQQNWADAEHWASTSLPLSEKVGRQELIAAACHRLAEALVRQSRCADALPYAQRAVDIFTRLGIPSDLADARKILEDCQA